MSAMTLFQVFALRSVKPHRVHLCPPFNYVGREREPACHTVFAQDGRVRGVHLTGAHRAARANAHCFGPVLIEAITAAAPARMQRNCVGSPWVCSQMAILIYCSRARGDVLQ